MCWLEGYFEFSETWKVTSIINEMFNLWCRKTREKADFFFFFFFFAEATQFCNPLLRKSIMLNCQNRKTLFEGREGIIVCCCQKVRIAKKKKNNNCWLAPYFELLTYLITNSKTHTRTSKMTVVPMNTNIFSLSEMQNAKIKFKTLPLNLFLQWPTNLDGLNIYSQADISRVFFKVHLF